MKRYSPHEVFAQNKTVITAHSGCEGTPANSIGHIKAAIASGSEMIEVDVRYSEEHGFYLSHDIPADPAACVKLRDMFALVAHEEYLEMNLDVKTAGLIDGVVALAEEFGITNRIVFTGICNDQRAHANALGTEMWRSMWPGENIADGIAANKADGSPFLNVYFGMITEEYDKALRGFGNGFSAWTVDTEENLRKFLEMGISNITTRKPVLALKLRKEIQGI